MNEVSRWLLGILVCTVIIFSAWAYFLRDVDSCLDSEGCWDYSAKVCRKDEPNAQELCDQSNPF